MSTASQASFTQPSPGTQPSSIQPSSTQPRKVSWSGARDVALAWLLRDNWAKYQSSGGKIELCRQRQRLLVLESKMKPGIRQKHISNTSLTAIMVQRIEG